VSAVEVTALVVGTLLLIALVLAVVLVPVARRAKRVRAGIEEELGDAVRRIANARGLGLESRGAGQVRGNGWLVLTADELRFRQWAPQRETRIPLVAMTAVETTRWWLGKSGGTALLCVRWRTQDGADDAMAWQVSDLEGWLSELGARPAPPPG
jgi:hypothetical protein